MSSMADNEAQPGPVVTTNQISTAELTAAPAAANAASNPLYAPEGPDPPGTKPEAVQKMEEETPSAASAGAGIEGEEVVWEARYSLKNFLGRLIGRAVLTIGWLALFIYTKGYHHENLTTITWVLGVVLIVIWLALLWRILQARFGHYYRLTTRRLFVSTGLMRRRRDQMELLRVKDVYTRQSLIERWLSLGTVVVVSGEPELPTFYLAGVNDPKRVMDLVWHYARAERDRRSVEVDRV